MLQEIFKLVLIVPLGLIVIYLMVRLQDITDRKRIEKIFEGRERLNKDEFYARYYQDQGVPKEIVVGVISLLEQHLDPDLSRLQPADNFSTNLSYFFEIDDMADVEIAMGLQEVFSVEFSDQEAHNACSVDDLIQLVWTKVQAA